MAQLHDVRGLDDSGTMDAKESRRVEPLLERSHGFAHQVSAAVDVQLRVIPSGSNPFHIVASTIDDYCLKKYVANESSLGGESFLLAAGVDFDGESVEGGAQTRGERQGFRHDLGEFGPQQARVRSGEEQSDPQAVGCKLIPVAVRKPLNDAMQAEAAKIISHPSDGIVGWIEAQHLRQQHTHFPVIEPTQLETEYNEYSEQGLYALVAKAQRRCSLSLYLSGTNHAVKRILANRAIVRDLLDVQKTPVGLEADLP